MGMMQHNTDRATCNQPRRAALFATRFTREELGSMTIFAMTFMMLMIMMGGIAVDVMRYETRRTSLQNTLDRSTLAAASLTQTRSPEAVVDDYFRKAGVLEYLRSVTVTKGLNFRDVKADADADTNPLFLHLMGIDKLDAYGISQAEQRISNVEIMMVLDVSGSMAANNKLLNLQNAAKDFVATVMKNDNDHKISIGMVPFNGQINLGPLLAAKYNVTAPNGGTSQNCVDLPQPVYTNNYIDRLTPLPMTIAGDTYSGGGSTGSYGLYSDYKPYEPNEWCPTNRSGNIVRLPSQDVATMQGYINGLTAIGATSINAGMAWGLSLLDPQSRGIYNEFIASGDMSGTMIARPFDYTAEDTMKVIVLMTDGENFAEDRVPNIYKSGPSPIFKSNGDGNYSVLQVTHALPNQYYVPHNNTWQSVPWAGGGVAVPQTWPMVWNALRVQYVATQFYARPLGQSATTWIANFRTQTATTVMDTQMQAMCNAAKANNIIVYGIAFEAPPNGQTQILNCSTSSAHYFNASGIQISSAFAAIANNISQLRLTQ